MVKLKFSKWMGSEVKNTTFKFPSLT